MFKQLAGKFSDVSWSSDAPTAALPLQVGCYGHSPGDSVLTNPGDEGLQAIRDALPEALLPTEDVTNADVLATLVGDSSSSGAGALPYVYADFEWKHCAESGYDIRSLLLPTKSAAATTAAVDAAPATEAASVTVSGGNKKGGSSGSRRTAFGNWLQAPL